MQKKQKKQEKQKIGLIGCGNISGIYLQNLCGFFRDAEIVKCADLNFESARLTANTADDNGKMLYPNLEAVALEDMYTDPAIDIILNLTTPQSHYDVAIKALENSKHVYGEKPLAVGFEDGKKILALSKDKGLRAGSAPDTFLGAGLQSARKLIDDGWIGDVVSCNAFMCCPGHESWHPDPEFYYKLGGGPMFDMGPYYLTALVNMLGPVSKVCSITKIGSAERIITSQPKYGTRVSVETPTHLAGQALFASGVIGNLIMSFDVWHSDLPRIEIHGTEGSLSVPDPNTFGGEIKLCRKHGAWERVPLIHGYSENSRGLGVADLAAAINEDRPHRASAELGLHVLEAMHAFHTSSAEERFVNMETSCERPAPLPQNLLPGNVS